MSSPPNKLNVHALRWQDRQLSVLDQRLLPEQVHYDIFNTAPEVAEAIKTMRVRGAPAIGIAAAYAVALSVQQHFKLDNTAWQQRVYADMEILAASRPTAVNLFWALAVMREALAVVSDSPVNAMIHKAVEIHQQDIAANQKMGEMGADILGDAQGLLTHCNAGALATGGYGTALGVIRSAQQRQKRAVYAGETRPWLQGARLTVWELAADNIPTTLIADSAAAMLMQSGKIDWIIVGADRIAANGDVANKIGTYSLAVLAKHHGVKVMVVAPVSTIDFTMDNGSQIEIEQRAASEFLPDCYVQEDGLINAWNPVFDVTPAELISVIVTECGVVFNPFEQGVRELRNEYSI
ncbi:MAG: S-methyl-5-thioribose-1-phosphate isomerase [Gammaproteobacteria bacterium]|jgi:methylthioribose-1-phosphate isomerase|nr:S-methyl-5-thioribose-1-phosphate isomerase [Gammaproteobacteria bacterium]MBT5223104.1 S-methyl-5-thioribose-1-phosphate isomerase [Gammaproteobacteria bacterium]MBT5826235.1 S-methyl-5-thioribose-1-phosphate isomerase [Gammaproteobacteria bacterium]MBT5965793.1 S-methyl-5-thioribose-1-phosphate isomerase [Gammaproteobacteria bacterium]MBT6420562.1 S-methyl-5-thioribose-1-phosphate isomerase [Gammaproteobacteria bacterium]